MAQTHPHDEHGHDGHDHAGHHHDHGHGGHHHGTTDERRMGIAFAIIFVFMLVDVAGGLFSGSLALLADAGHMVSDAAALGIGWLALRVGKRPADAARTFGYRRLEVLAAFVNGLSLFVVAGWVVFEAVQRFATPHPILGGAMLIVAIAGTLANVLAFFVLSGGNQENLNIKSAWTHLLGDVLGQIAAIVAAGIILLTSWYPIDPILSVIVALLILKSAYGIVRSSGHILLEGAPPGLDLGAMETDLNSVLPHSAGVHHLHAWSLTAEEPLLTLHVSCGEQDDWKALLVLLRERLHERYGIAHSVIQVEPPGCASEIHTNPKPAALHA
ncbi:MAG TPA: cation diffusion facilitator family transporter [Rhizomicrobium sp.]